MIITEIFPYGKMKSRVLTDGDLVFCVYKGELKKYGLEEGTELSERMAVISDTLARKTLEYGFDGNSLAYETENGVTKQTRAWWMQAEAVVGFTNAFMKTNEKEFKNAERKTWEFIRNHVITKTRPAEWYNEVSQDGVPDLTKPLVGEWKCPYHNVRMCIEILRRNMRAQEEL